MDYTTYIPGSMSNTDFYGNLISDALSGAFSSSNTVPQESAPQEGNDSAFQNHYYEGDETSRFIAGFPKVEEQPQMNPSLPVGRTYSTYTDSSKWSPSERLLSRIRQWEGSSMKTNVPFNQVRTQFIKDTPNINFLSDNQKDSLYSYYYNLKPSTYRRTMTPLLRQLNGYSDKDTLNNIKNNINVGMNREGMSGLRKRRLAEQGIFDGRYDLGGTMNMVGAGLDAVAPAVTGGKTTGAGNVMNSLSSVAAMIPGPYGAIASVALKGLGTLTNAAFGSKMNQQFINQTEQSAAKQASWNSQAQSSDQLLNDAQNMTMLNNVNKSQVGSDGWFATKAARETQRLNQKIDDANNRAYGNLFNAADNISKNTSLNMMANYSAYGGPLNFTKDSISYPHNYSWLAEGGPLKKVGINQYADDKTLYNVLPDETDENRDLVKLYLEGNNGSFEDVTDNPLYKNGADYQKYIRDNYKGKKIRTYKGSGDRDTLYVSPGSRNEILGNLNRPLHMIAESGAGETPDNNWFSNEGSNNATEDDVKNYIRYYKNIGGNIYAVNSDMWDFNPKDWGNWSNPEGARIMNRIGTPFILKSLKPVKFGAPYNNPNILYPQPTGLERGYSSNKKRTNKK